MRGKKAKKIRRAIYGDMVTNASGRNYVRYGNGQIVADSTRRAYQQAKKRGL